MWVAELQSTESLVCPVVEPNGEQTSFAFFLLFPLHPVLLLTTDYRICTERIELIPIDEEAAIKALVTQFSNDIGRR